MFQIGMLVKMLLNSTFDLLDLLFEQGQLRLEVVQYQWRGVSSMLERVLAVVLALVISLQILQMTDEGLQLAPVGWRRCPGRRLLGATEVSDEGGIERVGLVAPQLALAVGFDLGWVDHTDRVTRSG